VVVPALVVVPVPPPPLGVTPPDAGVDAADVDVVDEEAGGATVAGVLAVTDALDDELVSVVDVVVVVEVLPDPPPTMSAVADAAGTVSEGAPVLRPAFEPPPPHAESPAASAIPAATPAILPVADIRNSGAERLHAPAAVRAVVQILLRELIAPVAEPEVLDRPGQLGNARGQRQQDRHHLELLAGLAVPVAATGLGFDHDFTTGRWRPHTVLLMRPHGGDAISGGGGDGPEDQAAATRQRLPTAALDRVPRAQMVKARTRTASKPAALAVAASLVMALGGCSLKHPVQNLVQGKKLFVAKCGSCHTLSHAGSHAFVGPNLDDAFRQDRTDGFKNKDIEGLVDYWIQYPNVQGVMPPMLFKGQQAQDVASYVAAVAAVPGQDTGALAQAVANVTQKPAVEKNGTVEIDADPSGQLKFLASSASATPGKVTVQMKNMSSTPHDIAIQGGGVQQVGQIVSNGGTSKVTATLKPGSYTFYCSVDGHEAAGMKGTLTVK
jgi:plastocyanin